MRNRRFTLIVIIVLLVSLVFASQVIAWGFGPSSLRCFGDWRGNVDIGANTDCTVEGTNGALELVVWCVNPNNAGNFSPPKVTQINNPMTGTEANVNARKVRGSVNHDFSIDLVSGIDASVCNQGGSNPQGSGQWIPFKALAVGEFTATVNTEENGPGSKVEVYACGQGSLFADGTNIEDWVDVVTQLLASGDFDLSDDLPLYNCTLTPPS